MKGDIKQIIVSTFTVVIIVVILEHAGGFSQILGKGAAGYATDVRALEGH